MTALVVLATGCPLDRIHTTRGATIVAFGVSGPEEPQYYDHAAAALDTHLKSQGFVVSTRPNFATVYVNDNKRRTWYYQSSSKLHVEMSQPTKDATGLEADVVWRATGFRKEVDGVEAAANRLTAELSEWWQRYQQEHAQPDAPK
jgi:hypothetical protein